MSSGHDTVTGAAVSLKDVSVAYPGDRDEPIDAVTGVDLDIAAGSIVALLGPSGCGKTSLLRAVAGLERPVTGEVTIGSTVVSRAVGAGKRSWVNPERRDVGMVFQDGALFPHLTVFQNILFGLRAGRKKLPRAVVLQRISDLLELVDLTGFADRMPGTLSGGQQQRVALARSLAPQPKVLLLDEPFSALDTALRVQVRAEVARIVREVGVTTVFVTHDQDEAFVLGDHVAVMRAGRIEQFGAPDDLYRSPNSPWVAGFVGEANFVVGSVAEASPAADATVAATPIGVIPITDRRRVGSSADVQVVVRPEQVSLTRSGDDPTSGQPPDLATPDLATITNVEYYGHDVRYELAMDDGSTLSARTHSTELFERGTRVRPQYQSRQRGSTSVAFSLDDDRNGAATPV